MLTYKQGLRDGLPIGLGYLSVSFAFGVAAVHAGVPLWAAVVISMTNLTSAGQLAGLSVITACGGFAEMALTQLVINLRYALMSISLSQKLDKTVTGGERLLMAFGNTDEIYAVSSGRNLTAQVTTGEEQNINSRYFYGLMTLPYLCWVLGTLLGAVADQLLPESILSALGVAIYGMFVAIVLPDAKKSRAVAMVAVAAAVFSSLFTWVKGLNTVSGGFAIIICAVLAAVLGAVVKPVED